jgi:putative membrane protein
LNVLGDGHPEGEPPSGSPLIDYRFSLANERTYLAWTRTALALIAGGVAVLRLLADSVIGFIAAYVLVGLGVLVAVAGLRRWLRNDQAMLHGRALEPTRLPIVLAIGLGVVGVLLLFD